MLLFVPFVCTELESKQKENIKEWHIFFIPVDFKFFVSIRTLCVCVCVRYFFFLSFHSFYFTMIRLGEIESIFQINSYLKRIEWTLRSWWASNQFNQIQDWCWFFSLSGFFFVFFILKIAKSMNENGILNEWRLKYRKICVFFSL